FQNGVGSEEAVSRLLPAAPLVAASVTIPVSVPAMGHIETRKKGGLGIAPVQGNTEYGIRNTELRQAGFVVRPYTDYRAMKWSKLLGNMIGNASSAILDMPPGEMYADPRLFRLEVAALREAVAVMSAWRIPAVSLPGLHTGLLPPALRYLPLPLLQRILQRMVTGGRGGKMPSLHIDMAGGKGKSEVQFLNGAVVEWGERKGVPTPVNRLLTDTLLALMAGRLTWSEFRQRPDRLLKLLAG
ncbi:MAG: 2-dehydropantoate 2-reductase, partial [Anaerolineae bacterium]|nr:2-dehydropantoate 2-reductase [Anaerolineae bacterium]